MRRVASLAAGETAAVVVLAVATLSVAPGALDLRRGFTQGDAGFSALAIDQLQTALLSGASWRTPPLAWPMPDAVTQTDFMAGQAVLGLPLRLLGVDPLVAYGWISLLGLFATAWCCHRAAKLLLGPGPHTWVAGVIGGLGPVQLLHAQHTNLVHHEWAVGGSLLLATGLAARRPVLAGLGGGCVGVGFWFGAYAGLHAALAIAAVAACAGVARVGDRWGWLAASVGAALSVATFAPVAVVYFGASHTFGISIDPAALHQESWDLATTLAPVPGPLFGWLLSGPPVREPPNPGYLALILAGIGFWSVVRGRRAPRWAWAGVCAAVVVAAMLAIGPRVVVGGEATGVPGPLAPLWAWVPALSALRAPGRWLAIVGVGMGLFAAAGLRSVRWRWASVAALPILLLEAPRPQIGWLAEVQPDAAFLALDDIDGPGAVWVQTRRRDTTCACAGPHLFRADTFHGRPRLGVRYARIYDRLLEVNKLAAAWPDPAAEDLFRGVGVVATIEHPPIRGRPPDSARCEVVHEHRVCRLAWDPVGHPLVTWPLPDQHPRPRDVGDLLR